MSGVINMEDKKDLPKRKDPRLKGYDYSKAGAYFLTICTQNRKNILSKIVGEGFPLPSSFTIDNSIWIWFGIIT